MAEARTIAEFFGLQAADFSSCDPDHVMRTTAFVAIDVQRAYCDPNYEAGYGTVATDRVAGHIASLVPQFRAAGMPIYWVYYYTHNEDPNDPSGCRGGFHKNAPVPGDVLIAKDKPSAFRGSDIRTRFLSAGIKRMIVCGFSTSACVWDTVYDGVQEERLKVSVLPDATGNNRPNEIELLDERLTIMHNNGIIINPSYEILEAVQKIKVHDPSVLHM